MGRFLMMGLIYALSVCLIPNHILAEPLSPRRTLLSSEAVAGTLMLIGGGTTPPEIHDEFIRLAGGEAARVVHIPTATSKYEAIPNRRAYYDEWYKRQLKSFEFVHTRSADEARQPGFAAPLHQATGVWIGGGDQNRLMESYHGTPVVPALHEVMSRGGVIAGTSSGAAIMSDVMICDESYHELVLGRGFALCPNTIVESHLTERHRVQRLLSALASRPDQIGIGVDENTALVIQNQQVRVIGQGDAWFFIVDGQTGIVTRHRLKAGEEAHPQVVLSVDMAAPELAKRDTK